MALPILEQNLIDIPKPSALPDGVLQKKSLKVDHDLIECSMSVKLL